jgi:hypothetical protein
MTYRRLNGLDDKEKRNKDRLKIEGNFIIGVLVTVVVLFLIVTGYLYYTHNKPFWDTEDAVRSEASKMVYAKKEFGKHTLTTQDAWGSSLQYVKRVNSDGTLITHVIKSPGPDRQINTGDDIVAVKTDMNKSKIVGKWIGKKSNEVLKGFIGGVKNKSEFDQGEGEKDKPAVSERIGKTAKGAWDGLKKGWKDGPDKKEGKE